jgi:hypothetical protein
VSDDIKKSASDTADSLKQAASGAADTLNTAKEQARDYAERGMEYASDYSGQLAEFVKRTMVGAGRGVYHWVCRGPAVAEGIALACSTDR